MNWNHRVVKFDQSHFDLPPWYEICECYYQGERVVFHTENGVKVCGESIEELRETLELMLKCLDKPIVDEIK